MYRNRERALRFRAVRLKLPDVHGHIAHIGRGFLDACKVRFVLIAEEQLVQNAARLVAVDEIAVLARPDHKRLHAVRRVGETVGVAVAEIDGRAAGGVEQAHHNGARLRAGELPLAAERAILRSGGVFHAVDDALGVHLRHRAAVRFRNIRPVRNFARRAVRHGLGLPTHLGEEVSDHHGHFVARGLCLQSVERAGDVQPLKHAVFRKHRPVLLRPVPAGQLAFV